MHRKDRRRLTIKLNVAAIAVFLISVIIADSLLGGAAFWFVLFLLAVSFGLTLAIYTKKIDQQP